jgi:hypothetical protein
MMGSVKYAVSTADGQLVGTLQRQWASFLWSATYRVFDGNGAELGTIRQQNPWVRVLHGLVDGIPIVGIVAQMFVNPTYVVDVPVGANVMRLVKKVSFASRTFVIESVAPLVRDIERIVLPAVITFALMERARA